ncbi:MAG: hypothetical protein HZA31_07200 [Opitutae bacterium]|nr:hypothetical protein [Opitutae bacterium]
MNLPHRQRWLVILAGAAVLLLVLDSIVFTPLAKYWKDRSTEIVSLQKQIANGRSMIERAQHTEGLWKEMQAGALPKDPAQAEQEVISAFDRWGQANGVTLGSIKPQWKRGANARYSLLECRIDATGTLANLTRFLYEVEKSPLALRIDSVELATRDDYGQKLSLGLLISGLRLTPLEGKP